MHVGEKHLILRSRHRGTWNQVVVELNHELEEHDALKKNGKSIFKEGNIGSQKVVMHDIIIIFLSKCWICISLVQSHVVPH